MNLNLTLVVQAFHFGIAYVMLKRFFFKPIVQVIYQEDKEKEQLEVEVQLKQQKIAHELTRQQAHWRTYERYFEEQRPHIQEVVEPAPLAEIEAISRLSSEEIEKEANKLAQIIIKTVDHVE